MAAIMSCSASWAWARVAVTDTHTRQVKDRRIRALAEVNPQLTVKRHRGARAARDKTRSISCVQHPSSTRGHMKIGPYKCHNIRTTSRKFRHAILMKTRNLPLQRRRRRR